MSMSPSLLNGFKQIVNEVYDDVFKATHRFTLSEYYQQDVDREDLLHDAIIKFLDHVQNLEGADREIREQKLNEQYVFSSILNNFRNLLFNNTERNKTRQRHKDEVRSNYIKRQEELSQFAEQIEVNDIERTLPARLQQIVSEIKTGTKVRRICDKYDLSSMREYYDILDTIQTMLKRKGVSDHV